MVRSPQGLLSARTIPHCHFLFFFFSLRWEARFCTCTLRLEKTNTRAPHVRPRLRGFFHPVSSSIQFFYNNTPSSRNEVKSYFSSNISVIKYKLYRKTVLMKSSSSHFTKTWHAYEIHFSQQNTKTQVASPCSSFVLAHLTQFGSLLNYPQVQNKSLVWSGSIRKSVLNHLFYVFYVFFIPQP